MRIAQVGGRGGGGTFLVDWFQRKFEGRRAIAATGLNVGLAYLVALNSDVRLKARPDILSFTIAIIL